MVQLGGEASSRKKKRTTIRPARVGAVLLVLYVSFVGLVLTKLEDGPSGVGGGGSAQHLVGSVSSSYSSVSRGVTSMSARAGSMGALYWGRETADAVDEHLDLVHFCGECRWKDTLHTCDERVAYEVATRDVSSVEARKRNLIYCTAPMEHHVADFCGDCWWKDTPLRCDARVAWEVANRGLSVIEARRRNHPHCRRPPYLLSPLCGGCLRALSNTVTKMYRFGVPCYDVMHQIIAQRQNEGKNTTILDAARMVAETQPECRRCHPEECWKGYFADRGSPLEAPAAASANHLTKYWRFDRSAPQVSAPTTLALPAIPKRFRIPPARFHDIEAYLTEKYDEFETSADKKHVPIFIEYNPAIAPLPRKMKKYLPRTATYLMALRVTPANNCFRREDMTKLPQKIWDHTMMSPTNLLGLALLDQDYAILPGYDIVADIATRLGVQRYGYGTTYTGEPTFMDYRLFTLNDELYLHANTDITVVTKLDVRSKDFSKKELDGQFKLQSLYGEDNLEVTLLHQFNAIWSGGDRGKNFALFSVPNSTHPYEPDSVFAEVDINPHHVVQQLYLDEFEHLTTGKVRSRARRNYAADEMMQRKVKSNGNLTTSDVAPSRSFSTVDEHWFPGIRGSFRKAGHGGACCVSLTREEALRGGAVSSHRAWVENDYLLVGVAHTSVQFRTWYRYHHVPESAKAMVPHTHYVSFFYAFEPRPPFNLQALSGYFCLGFAGGDGTEGGMFNPHSVLTVNRKLSQNNETFNCPQIHFVSSFIEKVNDPSATVIGYGINDCTPRIVEVKKSEITRLLFPDPWEMQLERSKDAKAESLELLRGPRWGEA